MREGTANRRSVALLVADRLSVFEFGIACEVFGLDRSAQLGVDWYEMFICAPKAGPITTQVGIELVAPYGAEALRRADTIVALPAGELGKPDQSLVDELQRAHARGARILSLCTGVFVLAAAGLLEGRTVTTHWGEADRLALDYPGVTVDPCVLYVDDGTILTSAGSAAAIDLCLYVVRQDFGAEVAASVARSMVVPPHRDGGQAQFIDRPIRSEPASDRFNVTLEYATANLATPLTVEALAAHAAMSSRSFARHFRAVTGTTPRQWLLHQRVLLARRLLERTDLSVDLVATRCGLGSAANLRTHFQRIVRTTPQAYRRTFLLDPSTTPSRGFVGDLSVMRSKDLERKNDSTNNDSAGAMIVLS